ncbi:MAG: hypothetical protein CHACPFDD_02036 [Phycisphaerae bacterium]|nr:hypothetical protein [Phycisphaerae bacterium]
MNRHLQIISRALLGLFVSATAAALTVGDAVTPADALKKLQIGHARYLCGKADHPNESPDRRHEAFTDGQHPYAIILSCSDSRAPVELVFDAGIGDLFVVRVAGNVSSKHQLGSIEYAAEHLHAPLVVVMGHRGCGAVSAALADGQPPGNVRAIVETIRPAVERAAKAHPDLRGNDLLPEAVQENVWLTMESLLTQSHEIPEMIRSGKLMLVGAVYDIETGTINWLGTHPDERKLLNAAGAAAHSGDGDTPAPVVIGADAKERPAPHAPAAPARPAAKPAAPAKSEPPKQNPGDHHP